MLIGKVNYFQERSAGLTDLLYHFRNKYRIHAVCLRYKIINLKSRIASARGAPTAMMVATMVDADDSRRGGLALVDIGAEAQKP